MKAQGRCKFSLKLVVLEPKTKVILFLINAMNLKIIKCHHTKLKQSYIKDILILTCCPLATFAFLAAGS